MSDSDMFLFLMTTYIEILLSVIYVCVCVFYNQHVDKDL